MALLEGTGSLGEVGVDELQVHHEWCGATELECVGVEMRCACTIAGASSMQVVFVCVCVVCVGVRACVRDVRGM